jgi:hypothetical protein
VATYGKYLDSRWAPQPHAQPLEFVYHRFTVLEGGRALLALANPTELYLDRGVTLVGLDY